VVDLREAREGMVRHIEAMGVRDARVLQAMREVPRHRFVPPGEVDHAHQDRPLPIGLGQTISQPYIVAFMAEALALTGVEHVLEVGSGSGYFAALLARLAADVVAVELEPDLATRSAAMLKELGVQTVAVHAGDGALGWPGSAPFDAIVLSCAALEVPPVLWSQLKPGGVLLAPLGPRFGIQYLVRFRGGPGSAEPLLGVAFVPLR
jgi:protein-L-isoaspartate(D-aspartate) O-methyltransferase